MHMILSMHMNSLHTYYISKYANSFMEIMLICTNIDNSLSCDGGSNPPISTPYVWWLFVFTWEVLQAYYIYKTQMDSLVVGLNLGSAL